MTITNDSRARISGDILDRLSFDNNGRIFDLYRMPDGSFVAVDGCDEWFEVTLTPDDLRQLAAELRAAADMAASDFSAPDTTKHPPSD